MFSSTLYYLERLCSQNCNVGYVCLSTWIKRPQIISYLGPGGIFSDCRLSCPMREQMTTSELATYLSAAWPNKRVKRCKEKS